jgi:hypothetical protein
MLPYCPPYRLALRSTSLGGSRRAPLARHQLDELSLWVVELAPRLWRALQSPPGGSPHIQSRRPPARTLSPRGGTQRDHPSRVSQPAAGGRAEEPKALPPTRRMRYSPRVNPFCVSAPSRSDGLSFLSLTGSMEPLSLSMNMRYIYIPAIPVAHLPFTPLLLSHYQTPAAIIYVREFPR